MHNLWSLQAARSTLSPIWNENFKIALTPVCLAQMRDRVIVLSPSQASEVLLEIFDARKYQEGQDQGLAHDDFDDDDDDDDVM